MAQARAGGPQVGYRRIAGLIGAAAVVGLGWAGGSSARMSFPGPKDPLAYSKSENSALDVVTQPLTHRERTNAGSPAVRSAAKDSGADSPPSGHAGPNRPLSFDPQPTRTAKDHHVTVTEHDIAVGGADGVVARPNDVDDAVIHLKVYDPDTSDEPSWPKPVIVVMGSNYDDAAENALFQLPSEKVYSDWYAFLHAHEVPRGYTVVEADLRGTGSSSGCWDSWGLQDAQDFRDVVAWASTYDGGDHPVGAFGGSAEAATIADGMRGAGPQLKTVVEVAGLASMYDTYAFDGVPFDLADQQAATYFALSHAGSADAYGVNAARIGCQPAAVLGTDYSGTATQYYIDHDFRRDLASVTASVLDVSGLLDRTVQSIRLDGYDDELPTFHRAILGEWGHDILDDPALANRRLDLHAIFDAWFDHFLGGAGNGVERWPAVQVQDSRGVWRAVHDVASMGTADSLVLGSDQSLGKAGAPGSLVKLTAATPAAFETAKLDRNMHLSGQVHVTLPVTFSTTTTGRIQIDVVEHLSDDSTRLLAQGFRAVDHLDSLEQTNAVDSNVEYDVPIRTHYFDEWLSAGSKLEIDVRAVPSKDDDQAALGRVRMVSSPPYTAAIAVDGRAVVTIPIANDTCGVIPVQSPPDATQLALTPSCPFKQNLV